MKQGMRRSDATNPWGKPLVKRTYPQYTPKTPETTADTLAVERADAKRERRRARNLSLRAVR